MQGRLKVFALGLVAVCLWSAGASAQQLATGPFTAAEADAGRTAYAANCAVCHQANLSGTGEQPPLAGPDFMSAWRERSTKGLYDDIRTSMPYGNGGSLSPQTYQHIVAFLLEANGARPGTEAFGPNTDINIGLVANGKIPADIAQGERPSQPRPR